MLIAIISILVLTVLVWLLNKILPFQICPICAGVTITWLWMILGMWFGLISVEKYQFLTAILMGTSIGGIVTELKKIFPRFKNKAKNTETVEIKKQLDDCC